MKREIILLIILFTVSSPTCKCQIPERLADNFKFLLYVTGSSDGIFTLKLDNITIVKDESFNRIPDDFDFSKEEIIEDPAVLGVIYYYDKNKDRYILEGGGTQQKFYTESLKPILKKKIKILLTYNGHTYKYIANPSKTRGKEFLIDYDLVPPKLYQDILQMTM